VLARRLRQLGLDCPVMSPTKTTRKPNERVKTDKKDAAKIAREFRNGDIVEVRVPPATDEAVRDVCRARTDAVDDQSRAKQRLKSFLLRTGHHYVGRADWSEAHMRYLRHLSMPTSAHGIVLEEYLQAIDASRERVERMKESLIELLGEWEWEPVVRALMAFKGFQEVAAMTIVSELGDLRRFESPRSLVHFLGLAPGEHSTGASRRQGAITKCGNGHARWMLVECAQHYRKPPKVSAILSKRQEGQRRDVKELSWRVQHRLSARYRRLKARGKREQKVIVAIARELATFVWELQNKCVLPIPANSID
jgi:transposase